MTRDEIISMALKAGLAFQADDFPDIWRLYMSADREQIKKFATLVAAATREECAALCDRFQARDVGMQPSECAAAIRAMSEKGQS